MSVSPAIAGGTDILKSKTKLPCGNLNRRSPGITRQVKRTRLKLIRLIHRTGHAPVAAIRRGRVRALQSAINEKLYSRDTHVITRRRRDRHVAFTRNDDAVRGTRDRNSGCNVIARSGKSDAPTEPDPRAR